MISSVIFSICPSGLTTAKLSTIFIVFIDFLYRFRLSGISPFESEDEEETMNMITSIDYRFDPNIFDRISDEAKTFIKTLIVRIPEKRPSATTCLEDSWLSDALETTRLASALLPESMTELSDYLMEQEEMEYVHASLVLRTFLQSPYDSPESESEEEDA